MLPLHCAITYRTVRNGQITAAPERLGAKGSPVHPTGLTEDPVGQGARTHTEGCRSFPPLMDPSRLVSYLRPTDRMIGLVCYSLAQW